MNDLWVGKHLLQIIDRTGGYAGRFQLVQKLFAFHSRGQRAQLADQFGAMLDAAFIVLIRRVLRELRRAENAAQFDELGVVASGNDDAPIGDRKFLIGHKIWMRIANALGKFAGDEIVERLERERTDRRIDQRSVDITAAPGLLAPRQSGKDADGRVDAGENICNRHADPRWRAVGGAGHAHDATDPLRHKVVTGARGRRSGLPETGDRAVDQPRIERSQAFVIETELDQPADLEVLDENIRARRELLDEALALGGGEIQLDRA